jgi:hypothetical protein
MGEIRVEHTFNCSIDTFWDRIFFDSEYNRRLFLEVLKFPEWKETRCEDKGDRIERTCEAMPRLGDLPGPLKKIVGEGVKYREEGIFDKATRRYRMRVIPNKMSDKLLIDCELVVEAKSDTKCNRVFTCRAEAKIFGVGSLLEKRLLEDMQRSQNISADFTNRYIAELGLT